MSEIKKYLNANNISYEQIVELYSSNSPIINKNEIYIVDNKFYLTINSNISNDYAILFKKKFKLKLISSKGSVYQKDILCHLEIIDLIEELKMENKYIFFDGEAKINFEKNILDLDKYLINDVLILYEFNLVIPEIISKEKLNPNMSYYPSELSDFFYDYFPYENKHENKKIKYKESEERQNLFRDLTKLYNKEEMRKYKMTGPTSNGKSFSLFFIQEFIQKLYILTLRY